MMLNFAANLSWMFKEWSFLDRFSAAADAGFRAVEYLFPYEHKPDEIARRLARNNLKQVLFNLPPGDWSRGERGIASLPGRQDEFRTSVKTALEYARATDTRRVHVMSGIVAGDAAHALARFRDAVAFACEEAAADGIDVMIEPINSRAIPDYLMNDFHLAERIIREMNRPNLKLQFDIYHRQIIHGDVTRGLEMLKPLIGHVQIASVPLRQEPTCGELDDCHVLQTLARLEYAGFIGCEYQPAAGTLQGLGWMKKVAIAAA